MKNIFQIIIFYIIVFQSVAVYAQEWIPTYYNWFQIINQSEPLSISATQGRYCASPNCTNCEVLCGTNIPSSSSNIIFENKYSMLISHINITGGLSFQCQYNNCSSSANLSLKYSNNINGPWILINSSNYSSAGTFNEIYNFQIISPKYFMVSTQLNTVLNSLEGGCSVCRRVSANFFINTPIFGPNPLLHMILPSVPNGNCINLSPNPWSIPSGPTWSNGDTLNKIIVCSSGVYSLNNSLFPSIGVFVSSFNDSISTPNGKINYVTKLGDTLIMAGDFNKVIRVTGNAALINNSSGKHNKQMPRFNAAVDVIIPDGGGGWYAAGDFTKVGIDSARYLVHIKSDMSLDTTFHPASNGKVESMAISGNKLYVGGSFTHIGDVARSYLAVLDRYTGMATSWDPMCNGTVRSLIVFQDRVYAGGDFTSLGGQTRNYLGAVDTVYAMATTWNPNANNKVRKLYSSGVKLYVAGDFTTLGSSTRNRLASYTFSTGLLDVWDPNPNAAVNDVLVYNGNVYIAGAFTNIGAQNRNYLAATNMTTGTALAWNPQPDSVVKVLALSGGNIIAGGNFANIGGQARSCLAAIDPASASVTTWNVPIAGLKSLASPFVKALAVNGNDIYAGGSFAGLKTGDRSNFAAISVSTGELLPWYPSIVNGIIRCGYMDNNYIYLGGEFTQFNGIPRNHIVQLSKSTGVPTGWNPNADGNVNSMVQKGLYLYVGGEFATIGGNARPKLSAIKLSDGTSSTWNPSPNGIVRSLALGGDTLYVGGEFTSISSTTRNRIASYNIQTNALTSLDPNANNTVYALAYKNRNLFAGGAFTTIGGQTRNNFASFSTTTGTITGMNPAFSSLNNVYAVAAVDSAVYQGGKYAFNNNIYLQRNSSAIKVNGNGLSQWWHPETNNTVRTICAAGDKIFLGGDFTEALSIYQPYFLWVDPFCSVDAKIATPSNTSLCEGDSIPLHATVGTGYSYQWFVNGNAIPGATGHTHYPQITGYYKVEITDNVNSGSLFSDAILMTVDPLADTVINASGSLSFCGGSVTLSAISNPLFSYLWHKDGQPINNANTNTLVVSTSGNYFCQVYNSSGCPRNSQHKIVNAAATPEAAGTITGTASVCIGQTGITYTVPTISAANSYVWTIPTGATGSSTTNSITVSFPTGAVSGNISVVGHNACGDGTASSLPVTVNSLPAAAGTITGLASVCKNQSNVTYSVPAINGATSYIWTLPVGANFGSTSTTNSITVDYVLSATSGNITVKGHSNCGDGTVSTKAITVNSIPSAAGTITGTASVCQGQSGVVYTVPAISGATSYVWTLPTGATGTSSTNSITVTYGNTAVGGNITVKGTNTCGNGTSSNLAITVNPLPAAAGTISGSTQVCAGQSVVTYTLPLIANATSYIWTIPTGATINGSGNSITVTYSANAVSGDISVKGSNSCGEGNLSVLPVIVHQPPVANAGTDQSVSLGNSATLSVSTSGGSAPFTYAWSNGATAQSITVSPSATTTYTVTVSDAYGCTGTDNVVITVTASTLLSTTAPTMNACPGNVVVPIAVTNCNDVASISLTLQYNTSVLTYTGYQNANSALATGFLVVNASNGQVQLGWFGMTPATVTNGALIDYKFTGVIGSSTLNWNTATAGACAYTDINNVTISSVFVNGNVTVGNCSNLDGTVTYMNTVSTPMNNTTVLLKQNGSIVNQMVTNSAGHFLFQNMANGTYRTDGTSTKPWGGVNASDGLLILKHFVNAQPLTGLKLAAADVDGSGYINSADALLDVKRFVNIISSFNVGDWIFEKDTVVVTGTGNITDDFKALCYGDVDGSYIPAAKVEPTISLQTEGTLSLLGESEINLPIRIKDNVEVGSISLALDIPDACLEVKDVVSTGNGTIVFRQNGSNLRIGWYSMEPMQLKAGDVLLTLKCSVNNSNLPTCGSWTIDPISQITDADAKPYGSIGLTMPKLSTTGDQFYLAQNVPNPFSNATEISYYLPEKGTVSLVISDMLGRKVLKVVNATQDAGLHKASVLANTLLPGIYTYTLKVNGETQEFTKTLKMIIER